MKKIKAAIILCLVCLLANLELKAQNNPRTDSVTIFNPDKRLTFEFHNTPLTEYFYYLSKQAGYHFKFDLDEITDYSYNANFVANWAPVSIAIQELVRYEDKLKFEINGQEITVHVR